MGYSMTNCLLAAGLAAMALSSTAAEPLQPPPPYDAHPDIIVEGRTEAAVDRFVEALTQSERGRQIARWNDRICPKVLGLHPAQASYITARIGALGRELGIPVASGRCAGNIIIVMSDDADNFTRVLVKRYPRLFADRQDGMASPGEIEQLLRPRPVRWIAASSTGNAYGPPITDGTNRIYSASRLRETTRENARLSFVIVDAARLQAITWSQLADYLTLVTLARPAMDANYGNSTVLSIFQIRDRGGQGPKRLTRDDRELLRGLYSTNAATSAEAQRMSIRRRIEDGGPSTEAN
jgi:hypothetical protein